MKYFDWTKEDRQKVLTLYAQGVKIKDIAKFLTGMHKENISYHSVRWALRKAKSNLPKSKVKVIEASARKRRGAPVTNIKTCSVCKRELPATRFHADKSQKDGLQRYCIECKHEHDVNRDLKAKYRKEYILRCRRRLGLTTERYDVSEKTDCISEFFFGPKPKTKNQKEVYEAMWSWYKTFNVFPSRHQLAAMLNRTSNSIYSAIKGMMAHYNLINTAYLGKVDIKCPHCGKRMKTVLSEGD